MGVSLHLVVAVEAGLNDLLLVEDGEVDLHLVCEAETVIYFDVTGDFVGFGQVLDSVLELY